MTPGICNNGGRVTVTDPTAVAFPLMVSHREGKPLARGVYLSFEPDEDEADDAGANDGNVRALIRYGVGGNAAELECDWNPGAVVVVPGETVEVYVKYDSDQVDAASYGGRFYAHIVDNPQGSAGFWRATHTRRVTLAAGVSELFPIPRFAKGWRIFFQDSGELTSANTSVFIHGGTSASSRQLQEVVGADVTARRNNNGFFPLPGGSEMLRVLRAAGAAEVEVSFLLGV